jgi:sulfatase maturation enzyme AslB (radical SAM superfamily)
MACQDGEPTVMRIDFFRRSVEMQHNYAPSGQRILNTIQTNGTLLDEECGEFLEASEFLVGISVDCPAKMDDEYRLEPGKHYLCPSDEALFRHLREPMQAMSCLLRAGRAPAKIMTAYASRDAARRRNHPRPSLSGRKWERCHCDAGPRGCVL